MQAAKQPGTFRKLVPCVFAVSVLIMIVRFAQPALADGSPGSFAISAGIAFQNLPSAASTPPTLGFDYGFPTGASSGQPMIYLDLRASFDAFVGAAGVGYSTESPNRKGPYAGIGVGYTYASFFTGFCCSQSPPCVDFCGPPAGPQGSSSGVGGKVFAGVYFTKNIALEGNYEVSPSLNGFSTSAAGLQLKYRFR
jgi:hypothetical protein